jgi:hypothetical protein
LRFEVFNLELNEGLVEFHFTGLDVDLTARWWFSFRKAQARMARAFYRSNQLCPNRRFNFAARSPRRRSFQQTKRSIDTIGCSFQSLRQ